MRDSFRAFGKPAHSVLTVAMKKGREEEGEEEREKTRGDNDLCKKSEGIWEIKGTC